MNYQQLTVLIPSHGLEDLPTDLAEKPAASLLNCFACLWHPRLLQSAGKLPRWYRADSPDFTATEQLFLVPITSVDQLPTDWMKEVKALQSTVVSGEHEREKILAQALASLEPVPTLNDDLTADFLAFGTTWLLIELLTRRMRSYSNMDEIGLEREMLAAADAACQGHAETARKHLGVCFEKLLEARERFYPVDCFLLDLCLVSPETVNENFARLLESPVPVNLQAPGKDWLKILEQEPLWQERIRSAIERKTAELTGGDDEELPTTLLSLDTTIWHLQQGQKIFTETFGHRPVTWVRKRFGLGTHLPQILNRMGYQGALHVLLDDGLYPDQEQSQSRWDGNSGLGISAMSRIPIAADSASGILRFAERMADSMDMDHVAAVIFARWPDLRTPYLNDLRRAHRYHPVLGKFVRFEEFFAHADGPVRQSTHAPREYLSPGLVHAAAASEPDPVTRYLRAWKRERAFLEVDWSHQISRLLREEFGPDTSSLELEQVVRAAHPEASDDVQAAADRAIQLAKIDAAAQLHTLLATGGEQGNGVLVINPLSFPRRALIEWPSRETTPEPDPNVLGVQVDSERTLVLVNLPPCGFVWLRGTTSTPNRPAGKRPLAEDLILRNETFEVHLSQATGGIAAIQTYRRSPNRLSQQLALRFPYEKLIQSGEGEERTSSKTFYTSMQLRESRIISEGPLVGEIETLGDLLDESAGEVVATYRQRTRVTRGRPVIDVDLELSSARDVAGDPWTNYIGCRFAWQHLDVALTGSAQQGAHAVAATRIESPQYLEIADDEFRTTLLTPGMPFFRKTGERMLDLLLVTEGERSRNFQFSVAIDSKYPMQASLDAFSSPLVVTTATRPAEGSRTGWFFGLSAANVQLTRILPSSQPRSLIVRLLETEGRGRVLGLQCFRNPIAARQVNFQGETITELRIDDAVNVEISPYEICDIELTF